MGLDQLADRQALPLNLRQCPDRHSKTAQAVIHLLLEFRNAFILAPQLPYHRLNQRQNVLGAVHQFVQQQLQPLFRLASVERRVGECDGDLVRFLYLGIDRGDDFAFADALGHQGQVTNGAAQLPADQIGATNGDQHQHKAADHHLSPCIHQHRLARRKRPPHHGPPLPARQLGIGIEITFAIKKIAAEGLHFREYVRVDEGFAHFRLILRAGNDDAIGPVDNGDRPVARQVFRGDQPAEVAGILRQDQGIPGRIQFRAKRHGNVEHPFLAGRAEKHVRDGDATGVDRPGQIGFLRHLAEWLAIGHPGVETLLAVLGGENGVEALPLQAVCDASLKCSKVAVLEFRKLRQEIERGGDFLQAAVDVAGDHPHILDGFPLQVVAFFRLEAEHQIAAEKNERERDDSRHHHQIGADGGGREKIRTAPTQSRDHVFQSVAGSRHTKNSGSYGIVTTRIIPCHPPLAMPDFYLRLLRQAAIASV
ncbi:hypothetical protein D3C78_935000 [compost metagenome]